MSEEKPSSESEIYDDTKENFSILQDMDTDKNELLEDTSHFDIIFHDAVKLYKTYLGPYEQYDDVSPSVYIQEFMRSHEERQILMNAFYSHLNYQNSEVVEFVPHVILFQGWVGESTYTSKLTITNKLRNPLNIKVKCEPSQYFRLLNQHNQVFKKIAHGITASFTVVFRPNLLMDYEHKLHISTSFHDISIPIYAIGPRPIIDFPDIINFGDVPVKFLSQRVITLRNMGRIKAVASLSTFVPFAVRPTKIAIDPNKTCSITVSFASLELGVFMGKLHVTYDTGDKVCIKLMSMAENIKVSFDTDTYHFETTYIGTRTTGTIYLRNDTNHVLKFKFYKNLNYTDDMKELLVLEEIADDFVDSKAPISAIDAYYTGIEQHGIVSDRIVSDEINHSNLLDLSFYHPDFEISPLEGQVLPHTQLSIGLIFKPTRNESTSAIAYCDIEGVDQRFTLHLDGTGNGATIVSEIDVINFGLVFLGLEHCAEAVFKNIGPIGGQVDYVEEKTYFGGKITCEPKSIFVTSNEVSIVCIKLTSRVVGTFYEVLTFRVANSDKVFKIIVKGKIVCPKLTFDQKMLNFGYVPFGFPVTLSLMMTNHSPVSISYRFEVKDGTAPAMLCWDYAQQNLSRYVGVPNFNSDPQEITVDAQKGVLAPNASRSVNVTVLANVARSCIKPLKVFLWDEEYPDMEVKIKYVAEPAKIIFRPNVIHHRFAFIDFPRTFTVTIENQSETSSFFIIIPQQASLKDPLVYHTNVMNGILKPHCSHDIAVTVIPTKLGNFEKQIMIQIFGYNQPSVMCKLYITSIGPCVVVEPNTLFWEPIPLLTDNQKSIALTNISPVPAKWKAEMLTQSRKKHGRIPWKVSQVNGVLMPDETMGLEVTAHLIDAGTFKAILSFEVEHGKASEVYLTGIGVGSSIVFTPDITQNIHFGNIFRSEVFLFPVVVENKGTRIHHLVWSAQIEGGLLKALKGIQCLEGSNIRITPFRMSLHGGEIKQFEVEMYSEVLGYHQVEYILYAIIDNRGKRITLAETKLSANFIEPVILVEPNQYHFFMEIIPPMDPPRKPLIATFRVTSEMVFVNSEVQVAVQKPFYLLYNHSLYHRMTYLKSGSEDVKFTVLYDAFTSDRHNKIIKKNIIVTVDNKYMTKVPLTGEIIYPNITLHSHSVDFGICQPCMDNVENITICNRTFFPIDFTWKILPETFVWYNEACELPVVRRPPHKIAAWYRTPNNYYENLLGPDLKFNDDFPDDPIEPIGTEKEDLGKTVYAGNLAWLTEVIAEAVEKSKKSGGKNQIKHLKDIQRLQEHLEMETQQRLATNKILAKDAATATQNQTPKGSKGSKGHKKKGPKVVETAPVEPEDENDEMAQVDVHNIMAITEILCPILAKYLNTGLDLLNKKILLKLPYYNIEMPWELDLSPRFGTLPPHTCMPVSVFFKPDEFGFAKGEAVIEVVGGPPEYVSIVGACGLVQYKVEPEVLNFGIRQFCTIWKEKITISNLGSGTFDFELIMSALDALTEEMRPMTYSVTPTKGTLVGETSAEIDIVFYPGVCGHVEKYLTLHIACLLPYNLRIIGYATMPQLAIQAEKDLSCPDIPIPLCYKAIGNICSEFFDKSLAPKPPEIEDLEVNVCLMMPEDPFIPEIYEEGWVIITENDFVPSIPEINLACERELTRNYNDFIPDFIQCHALNHNDESFNFPYFYVPGYKIDFGGICFGTTTVINLPLYNPGSIPTEVHMVFPLNVHDLPQTIGFEIKTTRSLTIPPGTTKKIPLIFSPGTKYQKRVETPFQFYFKIKIKCGAIIPVHIHAMLTIPKLSFNRKLNFGTIKCSQKKVMKFALSNNTPTTVEWSSLQRPIRRSNTSAEDPKWITDKMDSPFEIYPDYGLIQPYTFQLISVDYIPLTPGVYERMVEFYCVHNQECQTMRITGSAVDPLPTLETDIIDFGNAIPFLDVKERFLRATNDTPFPMEIYFPGLSPESDEKKIFTALSRYYQVPSLFIPTECFENSMTEKLADVYYNKLGALAYSNLEKFKPPKPTMVSRRASRASRIGAKGKKAKTESENKIVKPAEEEVLPNVDEAINLYLNYLDDHPSFHREDLFYIPKPPKETEKGKLILFGGGPGTDYKNYAKKFATLNNYKYITLDDLILEQATEQVSDTAKVIKNVINKIYCSEIMYMSPNHYGDPEKIENASDISDLNLNLMVKLDAIVKKRHDKKMQEILDKAVEAWVGPSPSGKLIHHDTLGPSESPKKLLGKKHTTQEVKTTKKKLHKKDAPPTEVAGIPSKLKATGPSIIDYKTFEDLNHEIIRELICPKLVTLMTEQGVVLDFMQNEIIKNSMEVVKLIWKCFEFKNHNVSCITIHSSLEKYMTEQMDNELQEQEHFSKRKQDLMDYIEKLNGFEFIQDVAKYDQINFLDLLHQRALRAERKLQVEKENVKKIGDPKGRRQSAKRGSKKSIKRASTSKSGRRQSARRSSSRRASSKSGSRRQSNRRASARRSSRRSSSRRASNKKGSIKRKMSGHKKGKGGKGGVEKNYDIDPETLMKIRRSIMDTMLQELYWKYEKDEKDLKEYFDKIDPPLPPPPPPPPPPASSIVTKEEEDREEKEITEDESKMDTTISTKPKNVKKIPSEGKFMPSGIPYYILYSSVFMDQIITGLASHDEYRVSNYVPTSALYDIYPPDPALYYWLISPDNSGSKDTMDASIQSDLDLSEKSVPIDSLKQKFQESVLQPTELRTEPLENFMIKPLESTDKKKGRKSGAGEDMIIPLTGGEGDIAKPLTAPVNSLTPTRSSMSKLGRIRKRKTASSISLEKKSPFEILGVTCPVPEDAIYPFTVPGPRIILQPGEEAVWPVVFAPKGFNSYKEFFTIKVAGWNHAKHVVRVIGNADIPTIDNNPYVIFKEVLEEKPKRVNHPVYLLDKTHFNFGFILISKSQKDKRLFQVETTFKLVNTSFVDIEQIIFSFYRRPEYNFSFDPPTLSIKAKSFAYLTVRAHPKDITGTLYQDLIYSIKDNPEPGVIQLCVVACKPQLQFIPPQLLKRQEYLFRTASESLRMKNDCGVPLFWILKNAQKLRTKGIVISKSSGLIGHNGIDDILITVYGDKPKLIKEDLHFELYHESKLGEPVANEYIPFELNIEDIIIDISYTRLKDGVEDQELTHLNFGTIKVNTPTKRFFYIYNQGTSEVFVRFNYLTKDKQIFDPSKIFNIKETNMRIKSASKLKVDVTALSLTALELHEEHMFSMQVTIMKKGSTQEPSIRDHIATIPIPVSIKVLYSMFNIQPTKELNFGVMEVDAVMNLPIVLENTGSFDFVYSLLTKQQLESMEDSALSMIGNMSALVMQNKLSKTMVPKADEIFKGKRTTIKSGILKKDYSHLFDKKRKKSIMSHLKRSEKSFDTKRENFTDSSRRSKLARKISDNASDFSDTEESDETFEKKKLKDLKKLHTSVVTAKSGKSKKKTTGWIRKPILDDKPTFYASKPTGIVPPGHTVEIIVSCSPQQEIIYDESYVLIISEASPEYKSGVPMHFIVEGCVPKVDFKVSSLFQDMDQVHNDEDVDLSSGEPIVVYNSRTNTIMFHNVILGESYVVSIFLTNESQIPSCLKMKLFDVSCESPFDVSKCYTLTNGVLKSTSYIPAYTVHTVVLKFKPTCLDKIKGKLDLSTKLQGHRKSPLSRFNLEGRAVLPIIKIIEPQTTEVDLNDDSTKTVLNFGNRVIGMQHVEKLTFQNVGTVIATVMIDVVSKDDETIKITLPSNKNVKDGLQRFITNQQMDCWKFILKPNEEQSIYISYEPVNQIVSQMKVILRTVLNPFEANEIVIKGYGYYNDISILGLEFRMKPQDIIGLEEISQNEISHIHSLDFGNCNIDDVKMLCFVMKNLSGITYFFEWDHLPSELKIVPSCGFILSSSEKQVYAFFVPKEPTTLQNIVIKCYFARIDVENQLIGDWSREKGLVKIIQAGSVNSSHLRELLNSNTFTEPTPYFKIINTQGKPKHPIHFLVNGTSDLPNITITPEEIMFDISYLFQQRREKIKLKNEKDHSVDFKWSIKYKKVEPPASWRNTKGFPFISMGTIGRNFYPPVAILKKSEMLQILQLRERFQMELENESSSEPVEEIQGKKEEHEKRESITPTRIESKRSRKVKKSKKNEMKISGNEEIDEEEIVQEVKVKKEKKPLAPWLSRSCRSGDKTKKHHHPNKKHSVHKGVPIRYFTKKKYKEKMVKPKPLVQDLDIYLKDDNEEPRLTRYSEFKKMSHGKSWVSNEELAKMTKAFTIFPKEGQIEPNGEVTCTVTFSPTCIDNFLAKLGLQVKGSTEEQQVFLRGISQMSYCHIEAEQSDYLTTKEAKTHDRVYAKETLVVEINAIGTGQTFSRKFNVLNPTKVEYCFRWEDEGGYELKHDKPNIHIKKGEFFICTTTFGSIPPGMSNEMEFLFKSTKPVLYESLWKLTIPELHLKQFILFVIRIKDPNVKFEPNRLELKPSLLGCSTLGEVKLKNYENSEIEYNFIDDSLLTHDSLHYLQVNPPSGVLPPNGEISISLQFTPKSVREIWFTAQCKIYRMYTPLELKVKTRCFKTVCYVAHVVDGKSTRLDHATPNIIDIGQLTHMIPHHLYFKLENAGILPWYYSWKLPEIQTYGYIHMTCSPLTGLLVQDANKIVKVTITVKSKTQFTKVPLGLYITKGPEYKILLSGSSAKPNYELSFKTFNFGPCIAQEKFHNYFEEVNLVIRNLDEEPLTVEKMMNPSPEIAFDIILETLRVPGRGAQSIPISFTPFEVKLYKTKEFLLINGIYKEKIELLGQGTTVEVSVVNRRDRMIDFGGVEVGRLIERDVEIINLGISTVAFTILGPPSEVLHVRPKSAQINIVLKPKEKSNVVLTFCPKTRGFTHLDKVKIFCQNITKDIFAVKGFGIGYDIALDREQLPFGLVTIGCNVIKKIALINKGDLGTSFLWDFTSAGDYFTISPVEGYSSPGTTLIFEIGFYPVKLMKTCRREVTCHLGNDSTLKLMLSGTSIELPPPKEFIYFKTNVRKSQTKTITVYYNNSYDRVILKPILTGQYFTCMDELIVSPDSECKAEIKYTPMVSTVPGDRHTATLFFAFPNGNVALYNLIGSTEKPLAEKKLHWDCKAKKTFTGVLIVSNWLQEPQKMKVSIKRIEKDGGLMPNKVEGLPFIDLPSGGTRDYKIKFFMYKEGVTKWKVSFRNEKTHEYMYFRIVLTTKGYDNPKVIEMHTEVRKPIIKSIPFSNPLDKDVTIIMTSPVKCLFAQPLVIKGHSDAFMRVEFMPLFKMSGDLYKIEFKSYDLGKFPYMAILTANSPGPEPTTYITGAVGESVKFVLRPKLLNRMACSFKVYCGEDYIKVPKFPIKKEIGGDTVEITLYLEPVDVGKFSTQVELISHDAGRYWYPLVVNCLPPRPQGPYIFHSLQRKVIHFKNPFTKDIKFDVTCTSTHFEIRPLTFELTSGQIIDLKVQFTDKIDQDADMKVPLAAKFTIVPRDVQYTHLSWIYYLKGLYKGL